MTDKNWTPEQALTRFCAAAFHTEKPEPRLSIPADPNYDDDLLLSAWIARAREIEKTIKLIACQDEGCGGRLSHEEIYRNMKALALTALDTKAVPVTTCDRCGKSNCVEVHDGYACQALPT